MLMAKKIRLKPTEEQINLFIKSCGVARWAYNFMLSEKERVYNEYLSNGKTGNKTITKGEVRKYINNVLKPTTHCWLKEVGSNVMKQAVKDADMAYKDFLKGIKGKPKYKSKHKDKLSFYVNYETLTKKNNGFHGEKIGFVKTSEPLPHIPKETKYLNPRITYDNKYWYLSVVYDVPELSTELTNESKGIDLGIKELAVCSDGKFYKNINKTKKMKQLKKKLKKEQRKLSKKIQNNILEYDKNHKPIFKKPLSECKNIQKQKHIIQLLNRRLNNIRNNHLHQTTTEIVKTKPSRIVIETLDVKNMMKNKYLANSIAEQKFFEFKRQIRYKTKRYGIELIEVPLFYPSSKICSNCHSVKNDLNLSDRIYYCNHCGNVIDRDFNAAINLSNYKVV